ncbi:hypothetical protein [Saprospira grandis]|uniref:Uncharacterized protein n=1 Tax=Saprospira grandis (strain Lewin) TaxID=984262 RepID=H6L096_SAPGL|nr:hypothetical protein [Saprospira grandis]AFC26260.1 hypothetical protein SGRA_3536 [Saprospira grandis str. Lewin]
MSEFKSVWDYDALWEKAKIYAQKSLIEDREGIMFPFWSTLTLEFLGRATLAKVHPVLLADPRDGSNILYVFGYLNSNSSPKSIPAKSVFDRCQKIVSNFTKKEFVNCLALIDRRNEELHSGKGAFENYPTRIWLSNYYHVCKILLEFQEKELEDLFGRDEADAANKMIIESDKSLITEVNSRIAHQRKEFFSLSAEDQTQNIEHAQKVIQSTYAPYSKIVECISCKSDSLIKGEPISVTDAKLFEDEIIQKINILPTNFTCFACGLKLTNHNELQVAEYGGQYSVTDYHDPAEYHGIDLSSEDFDLDMLFDYGND